MVGRVRDWAIGLLYRVYFKMAAPKRTKFERENDLQRITGMYLQHMTQAEIATELKLSQPQIKYDLDEIKRRWREDTKIDLDAAKQKELARLEQLEHTYWQAWKRSLKPLKKVRIEKKFGEVDKTIRTREQLLGIPAYLEGVVRCIQERSKLLGIYAPVKQDVKIDFTDELRDLLMSGAVSREEVEQEVGADLAKELFESIGIMVEQ